ncbi:T9SS type A sorting domain-containing protein [bacterium]|nr:T9SS type A sorting domain-containing protein [bacterium]
MHRTFAVLLINLSLCLMPFFAFAEDPILIGTYPGEWSNWDVDYEGWDLSFDPCGGYEPLLVTLEGNLVDVYRLGVGDYHHSTSDSWQVSEGFQGPVRGITTEHILDDTGILYSSTGPFEDVPPLASLYPRPSSISGIGMGFTEPDTAGNLTLYNVGFGDFSLGITGRFANFDSRLESPSLFVIDLDFYLRPADSLGIYRYAYGSAFRDYISPDSVWYADPIALLPRENGYYVVSSFTDTSYALYYAAGDEIIDTTAVRYIFYPDGELKNFTITGLDLPSDGWWDDWGGYNIGWVVQNEHSARLQTSSGIDHEVTGTITRMRLANLYAQDCDASPYFAKWMIYSVYNGTSTQLYAWMYDRSPFISVDDTFQLIPNQVALHPAYPNPFNASTVIPFELNKTGMVRIAVLDLLGREVGVLQDGVMQAGLHKVSWQPTAGLASGTYLLRLEQDGRQAVQRVQLVK